MEHRWVVHISGGSVGRADLTPDREAVGHLGSPLGRAEQMPSRPEVCGDAAEGGQEPLRKRSTPPRGLGSKGPHYRQPCVVRHKLIRRRHARSRRVPEARTSSAFARLP